MNVLNEDNSIKTYEDKNGEVKNMEYRYLKYQISDGYIVTISNEPMLIEEGFKIAISNNVNFEEGYEFDNYIVVQEVDENNILESSYMVKQPDSVKFLRQENIKFKANQLLIQSLLDEMIMGGGM
jgi:hypothetical protein